MFAVNLALNHTFGDSWFRLYLQNYKGLRLTNTYNLQNLKNDFKNIDKF